jgi:hypothetical protein
MHDIPAPDNIPVASLLLLLLCRDCPEEPVAWLADTAAALSRLLQYQRPQQLLLEATALLDVYCSLMQAQLAVANNYTSWPAYTAAGLGPMIQFALALLQPTQGSRPSGAVEKVLTELSQAYFKIRYHPIVAPTYSQALALTLEKQPEAEDSEDEGEGGEVQTAVPPPRPPVPGMWSVYNCQDPAQVSLTAQRSYENVCCLAIKVYIYQYCYS